MSAQIIPFPVHQARLSPHLEAIARLLAIRAERKRKPITLADAREAVLTAVAEARAEGRIR